MAARARRAVAHLARLALRAGGAPDAAAWAADTDDLPFGVHDADSVEAGAARAGPGGARQRGRRGAGRGRYAERVVCLAGRKDLLQTLLPARALGGAAQVVAASGRLAREDLFHAALPAAWRHGPRRRRNDSCGKQWERDRREHLSGGHREPSFRWAPGCLFGHHYHESPPEGTVAEQATVASADSIAARERSGGRDRGAAHSHAPTGATAPCPLPCAPGTPSRPPPRRGSCGRARAGAATPRARRARSARSCSGKSPWKRRTWR